VLVSGAGLSAAGVPPARPLAHVLHCRSELLPAAEAAESPRLLGRYNPETEGTALQLLLPADWAAQTGRLIKCGGIWGVDFPILTLCCRPFADALLADCAAATGTRVSPRDAAFALQPAAADVMAAAAASLGLQPWQSAPGAAVLACRGSPSGAGALMALAAALDCAALLPPRRRPRHAVALALGPGPSAEGLVLALP